MWPRLLNSIFELSSSSPVVMVNILNIILAPIPVSESINPLLINLSTSAFTPDKTNSNEPKTSHNLVGRVLFLTSRISGPYGSFKIIAHFTHKVLTSLTV